jgi:hypothetical protein
MQQVLYVANRKKRAVKASTVKESVLPNPLVSSACSVQIKDPSSQFTLGVRRKRGVQITINHDTDHAVSSGFQPTPQMLPAPEMSSAKTVDNAVQSIPSVECRSSRVGILKRGFKTRKHNMNVVDSQEKEPLAAAVIETVVPTYILTSLILCLVHRYIKTRKQKC